MNLCGSESEGVEVSTICRIISDIFLCVFRSHRSFRFGAWFEGHSRSKVLRENTSPPAGKIFTQTDRPDLDEAEQPDIPLHRRTEWPTDADGAGWWRKEMRREGGKK